MSASPTVTNSHADESADYRFAADLDVPAARIVAAVTDPAEIMRWWTAVSAASGHGDEIRLEMGDQALIVVVERPTDDTVTWSVTTCEMAPDWVGTRPTFTARPGGHGATAFEFRHIGLVPALECYEMCRAGWGHFMPSLRRYLETGEGLPNEPRSVSA